MGAELVLHGKYLISAAGFPAAEVCGKRKSYLSSLYRSKAKCGLVRSKVLVKKDVSFVARRA